jgi:hypothetical protein
MTKAELQEIFAEIDASFANYKRGIDEAIANNDFDAAIRRVITLAMALRGVDNEPRFQTHH